MLDAIYLLEGHLDYRWFLDDKALALGAVYLIDKYLRELVSLIWGCNDCKRGPQGDCLEV